MPVYVLFSLSLPVHKDKNNLSRSWLIAFGDFTGGRLWVESPLGSHPPPNPNCDWQKKLRGDFYDVQNKWVCFDPSLYHAMEEVRSGTRRSLALFTPKFWKRLTPQNLDELCELGFSPPTSAQDAEASATALPDVAVPSSLPFLAVVLDKTQGSMPGLASDNQALSAQEPLPEHTASTAFTPSIASKTRTETTTMTAMTIPGRRAGEDRGVVQRRLSVFDPLHRFQPQTG